MTQEALKLALEALEEYVNVVVSVNDPYEWTPKVADAGEPAREAITAIKEALAQTQEPVIDKSAATRIATSLGWSPQRTWVGLTDQEIKNLWNQHEPRFDYYSFSCDIEAKLKQKNGYAEEKNT